MSEPNQQQSDPFQSSSSAGETRAQSPSPLQTAPREGLPREDQPSSQRRRNVSSACLACREGKRKCSGPPAPCNACIVAKRECLFNQDLDQRRKQAVKRKKDDVEHHRDLLSKLLRSIRWSEEERAQELFRLIRRDAPLDEINNFIDGSIAGLRSTSPDTDSTIDGLLHMRAEAAKIREEEQSSRVRRKVMDIEEMADEPIYRVSASPWTTTTDDDYVVSHLVSIYFTWWNPFLHPLDETIFIEAMSSADLRHPLCSPFLVNAMLALSCCYSELPAAFATPDDLHSRGEHFHNEAWQMWEVEGGSSSLTNLQGLYLLSLYYTMQGKDKDGWSTMSHIERMYQDLGLFNGLNVPQNLDPGLAGKMEKSLSTIAWSVFVLNTILSIFLLKAPSMRPPKVRRPGSAEDLQNALQWRPYPRVFRVEPLYGEAVFDAYCHFVGLVFEGVSLLPSDGKGVNLIADELLERMRTWYKGLTNTIKIQPTSPAPLVDLHAMYYWCSLTISELSNGQPSLVRVPEPGSSESSATVDSSARKRSIGLIFAMLPILRNYRRTYGIFRSGPGACQAAAVAYFILLKSLENNGSDTSDEMEEALVDLTTYLMAGARRWLLYAGVLRMLRHTARQLNVTLPPRLNDMFEEFDRTLWAADAWKRINSSYPNLSLVSGALDVEDFQMGELLNRWESLDLGSSSFAGPSK